jgi:hypothetical protein
MKMISKFIMMLVAPAAFSMPVAAAAQDAAPQQVVVQQVSPEYAVVYEAPAKKVVLVQPAMGLALPPEEADILVKNSCLVGPLSTTKGLYDWAKKKSITLCSPKFWSEVDEYIGKESTIAFRVARVADGYEHCPNMKVANLGNNRESCRTYPFNPAHNNAGQVGKYGDSNWAAGGGTTTAQIGGGLLNTFVAGPLTAFTAQKFAPKCNSKDGGCGPAIYNVNQNQNEAAAAAGSSSTSGATIVGNTPCTASCVPTPTTNPNHTPNGPGN